MIKYIIIIVLSLITLGGYTQQVAIGAPKKNTKVTAASFTGRWKGVETCQSAGSPLALITIVSNGASSVLVSGMYSTVGKVKGSIKDDVLTIPLQQVNDPNFVNLALEATLTLSNDRQSIVARFNVQNNNMRDVCTATYKK